MIAEVAELKTSKIYKRNLLARSEKIIKRINKKIEKKISKGFDFLELVFQEQLTPFSYLGIGYKLKDPNLRNVVFTYYNNLGYTVSYEGSNWFCKSTIKWADHSIMAEDVAKLFELVKEKL